MGSTHVYPRIVAVANLSPRIWPSLSTPSHIVHTSEPSLDDVPIFDPIREKRARDGHTEQADEVDLDMDSIMR